MLPLYHPVKGAFLFNCGDDDFRLLKIHITKSTCDRHTAQKNPVSPPNSPFHAAKESSHNRMGIFQKATEPGKFLNIITRLFLKLR